MLEELYSILLDFDMANDPADDYNLLTYTSYLAFFSPVMFLYSCYTAVKAFKKIGEKKSLE